MNIGIVIAVSDYAPEIGALPACGADGSAMHALLSTEPRFDEVLLVDGNSPASTVKRQLSEFVAEKKNSDIDQIVFYFTGHGEFVNDEFYYLLKDFDPKRRKQTSLENSEVDSLLKALSPQVAVKFIDACHSGVAYVKDPQVFDTYLKGTTDTFAKCYFLFSSQSEQRSYQDSSLSFFTRSIVDAVIQHPNTELRYKDIIDYVSDAFSSDPKQTPFFVVQADFTENFCMVTDTLRDVLERALAEGSPAKSSGTDVARASLVERVRSDASRYCDENEASEALTSFQKHFVAPPSSPNAIALFDTRLVEDTEPAEFPSDVGIGLWLDQNQNAFFAEPVRKTVTVRRRMLKNLTLANIIKMQHDDDDYRIVHEKQKRVTGYRSTVDLPFSILVLRAEPKFPNLTQRSCFLVPIVSPTELRLFYAFCEYRAVGWSSSERQSDIKWQTTAAPLRDESAIAAAAKDVSSRFWDFVLAPIAAQFGDAEAVPAQSQTHEPDGEVNSKKKTTDATTD